MKRIIGCLLICLMIATPAYAEWDTGRWDSIRNALRHCNTSIIPIVNNKYDLGSPSRMFNYIYATSMTVSAIVTDSISWDGTELTLKTSVTNQISEVDVVGNGTAGALVRIIDGNNANRYVQLNQSGTGAYINFGSATTAFSINSDQRTLDTYLYTKNVTNGLLLNSDATAGNEYIETDLPLFQMGSTSLNGGTFKMIQGAVASDPTFSITQATNDVTIAQTVGDITVSAVDDIILTPDSANADTLTLSGDATNLTLTTSSGALKYTDATAEEAFFTVYGSANQPAGINVQDGHGSAYSVKIGANNTQGYLNANSSMSTLVLNGWQNTIDTTIMSKNSATAFVVNSDATSGNEYIQLGLPLTTVGTLATSQSAYAKLQVNEDNASSNAMISSHGWNTADGSCGGFLMTKSGNNTPGSHTIVANGEDLGILQAQGSDGTNFDNAGYILFEVDGTPGSGTDMPGRISFWTSPDGTATAVERMRIDNAGKVCIGNLGASPAAALTVYAPDAYPYITFQNSVTGSTASDGFWIGYDSGSAVATVQNNENTPLLFKTNNTEYLRITNTGNIQATTTAQQYQHDEIGIYLATLTAPKAIVGFTGTGATTTTEAGYESGAGRTWTYSGGLAADKIFQGSTYVYSFDGVDSYMSTPDTADMTFSTADTADTAFSIGGWIQVVDTAGYQFVIGKWDYTGGATKREYAVYLDSTEKVGLYQYDESAAKQVSRISDAALSLGWHYVVVTQSGTGGATAMNTALVYVDGVAVASTATNDAAYVAMENNTALPMIGTSWNGAPSLSFAGDMGRLFVTGETLSAADIWKMYEQTRGFYNK